MSKDIYANDGLSVTRFWGGPERKICFQFTVGMEYRQFTLRQTEDLCRAVLAECKEMRKMERKET